MNMSRFFLSLLEAISEPLLPFVLQLHHSSFQHQLHLLLHVVHLPLQSQQLLLYFRLPANPNPFLLIPRLPSSLHHRQHFLLQLPHFPHCGFLPPPFFFLPGAENGADSAIVVMIPFVVVVGLTIVVIWWCAVTSLFWGETDLMRDVAFPVAWSIRQSFGRILAS